MSDCQNPDCRRAVRERDSLARRLNDRWAQLDEVRTVLAELVRLKDGPRDEAYDRAKPFAWARARGLVEDTHTLDAGAGGG